jgi:hypothetical protein
LEFFENDGPHGRASGRRRPRWATGPAVIAPNLNNVHAQTASLRPSACAVPNYAPNLAILTSYATATYD